MKRLTSVLFWEKARPVIRANKGKKMVLISFIF